MATEIQTLQPRAQLDITQKQGGWLNAMTELATTPNAIANFGVQMAESASQTYQKLRGIEAGKSPSNTLLPPITKADKAFVDGYSAQAQQTLGLQAQQLINQAQLDLQKSYQLSNGQIKTYQDNVAKGLQQIIDQAPYTIKDKLANQYSEGLQSQVFKLNNQLLTQQKTQNKQNAGLYVKSQFSQLTDSIMTGQGNPKNTYANTEKYINDKQASGMWSASEAETQRKALKQLYLNNSLAKQAIDNYQNKTLEPYLNSLTNAPSEFDGMSVSYEEWESARNHALNSIVNYERFTSSEQNLLVSDAKIKFAQKELAQTDIDSLKQELQPQKFNELYGWILNKQNKNLANENRLSYLLANNTNIDAMARATPKEVNATYDATVAKIKSDAAYKGQSISDSDAQFLAISTIPRAIPAVNNMFSNQLLNGDAITAIQAASQIKRLEDADLSGRLDSSFSSLNSADSIIAHTINDVLPFSRSPDEAVAMARQIAFPTEEQKNAAIDKMQKFKKNYGSASKKISFAKGLVNVPDKSQVVDKSSFYISVADAYADALQVFGNESLAKSWVQKGIDQNYGTTTVNGKEQYTFMPIEKLLGMDKNSVPVIQQDIYNSVSEYVANMKYIYDNNKNLGFYYELAPRKDYNEFAQALLDPKTPNTKDTINEFLEAKPIQITKVYRNGDRVDYNLEVRSGPFASLGSRQDIMASGYDYILRNKEGAIESFHGTFGTQGRIPSYSPRTKYIQDASMTIQQATKQDWNLRLKKYLEESKGLGQRFRDIGLSKGEGISGLQKIASRDELALQNLGE